MAAAKEVRLARKAMAGSPVDGVLACLAILSRSPGNSSARRLLRTMGAAERRDVLNAVAALCDAGDWSHALRILVPLGRIHPSDAPLAEAEARCWMALGQYGQIAERLRRPLAKHPDHAGLLAAMGVATFNLDQAEAALPYLQKAAAHRPFDPHVANHLGAVLLSLGQLDAARSAFRVAVTESGGVPEAWANLANLVDFAAEPDLRTRLNALGPGAARRPAQRECLAFARAKAAFDMGDGDTAFAHLHEANALHRQAAPHDEAQHRATLLELIDRLPPGVQVKETGAPRVILVVGMPRSGTTLTEQILAAHPLVAGLGERPELSQLVAEIDTGTPWSVEQLQALADRYRTALQARNPGQRPVVIDKMPGNALLAGFALAALPNATVLHMRRDPVAIGFSIYRKRFTHGNDFAFDLGDIAERARLTSRVMAHWSSRFPGRVHDVVHEQLVKAPGPVTHRLLRLADLPPDPACLSFQGADGDIRTASAAQVRGPITRQKTADWQPYRAHLEPLIAGLGEVLNDYRAACARAC